MTGAGAPFEIAVQNPVYCSLGGGGGKTTKAAEGIQQRKYNASEIWFLGAFLVPVSWTLVCYHFKKPALKLNI